MALNIFGLLAQQTIEKSQDLSLSLLDQRLANIDIDIQTAGQIGELNKQLASINIRLARRSAQQDAAQIRRETTRNVATIRAGFAAAGVVSTEGSAFLAAVDQEMEGALEEAKILERAEIEILNSEIEIQKINLEQAFRQMKGANIKSQDILSTQADLTASTARLNTFLDFSQKPSPDLDFAAIQAAEPETTNPVRLGFKASRESVLRR